MGESHHNHQNHQQQPPQPSRLGLRTQVSGGGEIVEVQGGHIVRSTGRKDRHSKVCTAKGPRDRRVRLSAHTAIQFYDVQDRLGYDRPSKAVDWLIKKAKSAIDELAELPAWNPSNIIANLAQEHENRQEEDENQGEIHGGVGETLVEERGFVYDDTTHNTQNPNSNSGFLPASLDSDSIADTIRSFFPVGAQAETSNSSMQFQNYPPDLLSRSSSTHNQNQDLRLSLHSFADPILMHHHHHHHQAVPSQHQQEQALFGGFDTSSGGWGDHHQQASEINRFQRMVAWNGSGGGGGGGGFVFNSPPQPQPPLQPLFGENPLISQRGPLQSSNTHSIRAWIDPGMEHEHHHHTHPHHDHHQHNQIPSIHQSSISGIGFTSGGFSGFRIPARIQGDEEHDGISNKPSSASSDSRH